MRWTPFAVALLLACDPPTSDSPLPDDGSLNMPPDNPDAGMTPTDGGRVMTDVTLTRDVPSVTDRGATVTGIDSDAHYLAQAQWAARQFGLEERVTFRQMQVYDLADVGETFDLVLFMGVFYHLRYPNLALDIVAQRVGRMMVFQTLTMPGKEVYTDTDGHDFESRAAMLEPGWPKMAFIEHNFAGDPTNWWAPNHACVEAVLRASGLKVTAALPHELYLCAPDPEHPSSVTTWNTEELLSAIGARRRGANP